MLECDEFLDEFDFLEKQTCLQNCSKKRQQNMVAYPFTLKNCKLLKLIRYFQLDLVFHGIVTLKSRQ